MTYSEYFPYRSGGFQMKSILMFILIRPLEGSINVSTNFSPDEDDRRDL